MPSFKKKGQRLHIKTRRSAPDQGKGRNTLKYVARPQPVLLLVLLTDKLHFFKGIINTKDRLTRQTDGWKNRYRYIEKGKGF